MFQLFAILLTCYIITSAFQSTVIQGSILTMKNLGASPIVIAKGSSDQKSASKKKIKLANPTTWIL